MRMRRAQLSFGTPLSPQGPLGAGLESDQGHKVFPDVLQGWQKCLMETDGIWLFLKLSFCEEQPAVCGQVPAWEGRASPSSCGAPSHQGFYFGMRDFLGISK